MSKKRPEDLSLCLDEKGYDFTPEWPLASDKRAWLGQLRLRNIIEAYDNENWYKDLVINDSLNLFYDIGEQCSGGPLELIGNSAGLGSLGNLCNADTLLSVLPEVLKAIGTMNEKIFAKAEGLKSYDSQAAKRRLALLSSRVDLPSDPVEVLRGMHIIKGIIESKELYVYRGIWKPISDNEITTTLDAISSSKRISSKQMRDTLEAMKRDSRNILSLSRLYPSRGGPKDYHIVDQAGKTLDLLQAVSRAGYDVEPEFRPDLYLTTRIAARYDRKAPTRAIDTFLEDITAHPNEDVPVLQEWLGYNLLARHYPIEKALFLVGSGRGGRSTFYRALESMLGSWNVAHIFLHEMNDKFDLWTLKGKMANITPDLSSLPLLNLEKFKSITGGDSLTIHRKNFDDISDVFLPVKLSVGCNRLPYIPQELRDEAIFARLMIVELPFHFLDKKSEAEDPTRWKKRVADMVQVLTANQSAGLLNIAIEGLGRILEGGKKFSYKYSGVGTEELYDRLAAPENEVGDFIEDRCVRDPEKTNIVFWTPKDKLYAAYQVWASENGKERIGITAFTQGLAKNAVYIRKDRRAYRGIALKTPAKA